MTPGNDLTFPNAGISRRSRPLFCLTRRRETFAIRQHGRSVSHAKRPICETLPRRWPSSDRIGRSECISLGNFANPSRIVFGHLPSLGSFASAAANSNYFDEIDSSIEWRNRHNAYCFVWEIFSYKINDCELLLKYILIQWLKLQLFDKYIFLYKYIFYIKIHILYKKAVISRIIQTILFIHVNL